MCFLNFGVKVLSKLGRRRRREEPGKKGLCISNTFANFPILNFLKIISSLFAEVLLLLSSLSTEEPLKFLKNCGIFSKGTDTVYVEKKMECSSGYFAVRAGTEPGALLWEACNATLLRDKSREDVARSTAQPPW